MEDSSLILNLGTTQIYISPDTRTIDIEFKDIYGGILRMRFVNARKADPKHPNAKCWCNTVYNVVGHFSALPTENLDHLAAALVTEALLDTRLGVMLPDTEYTVAFPGAPKTSGGDRLSTPSEIIFTPSETDEGPGNELYNIEWNHSEYFYELPDETVYLIRDRVKSWYKERCLPKTEVTCLTTTSPLLPY